eukprot:1155298-Amphidinium_carterae.2
MSLEAVVLGFDGNSRVLRAIELVDERVEAALAERAKFISLCRWQEFGMRTAQEATHPPMAKV